MSALTIRAPAKWVLAGEHAVMRGAEALALPYPELSLELRFEPGGRGLCVMPTEAEVAVREAFAIAEVAPPDGRVTIESTIPRGAGLGSSAAFAVALSGLIASCAPLRLSRAELAKSIEDRLHGGTSSGMDVATVLGAAPILFRKGQLPVPLKMGRWPRFTLHDTGVRAATASCIARVTELFARSPDEAARIDAQMVEASALALAGLREHPSDLERIARAMRVAQGCFTDWGLEPPEARVLIQQLEAKGALAAKLTGAGGGGMVVALWSDLIR